MTDVNKPEENKNITGKSDDSTLVSSSAQSSEGKTIQPKINTDSTTTESTQVKTQPNTPKNKLSKTAVIGLIIAIAAAVGVAGIHFLHNKQNAAQSKEIINQLTTLNNDSEQRIKRLIDQQQTTLDQQVSNAINEITKTSQNRIEQLEQQLNRLEQNQPSDWLLHEAEYLIRIASRTIWLEQDTTAAINLLTDADARLKELNDPQYLPIRQLVQEDITALKLMPVLKTEEIILSLLALQKQIPLLSIAMASIPDSTQKDVNLELSENPADWRANLAKTWQRFLADFITVRRRTADVEPLMSPQYQQNLKENLALKLQQAQWAVKEQNTLLFKATLDDIQAWLVGYYDMGHLETAQFFQNLQPLKDEVVSYNYSTHLSALNGIRKIIADKQHLPLLPRSKELESEETESKQDKPLKEANDEIKNLKINSEQPNEEKVISDSASSDPSIDATTTQKRESV